MRRILTDSRNAGLPEAPLLNRIRQGAARHVGGQRVVSLVRAHADSMRAARVALGPRASADELDAGASALLAGASRAALHRLRAVRAEGTATTAIIVLTDLLWRGVGSNDAANAITELAQRSNDKALLALQGAVARDGTPASPQRLQSLVERFAVPTGDQPPGVSPTRRPIRPDTLASLDSRSTPEAQFALEPRASLALSSLSAPTGASPRAVLAEGEWNVPLWRVWSVAPTSALRLDEDGTRWSAGVAIARQLQPMRALGARVWLSGEVRSPVAQSRSELPLTPDLRTGVIPPGRARDMVLQAGTDLQRTVGPWTVTGRFALGHARSSSLETIFVPREIPIVPDYPDAAPRYAGEADRVRAAERLAHARCVDGARRRGASARGLSSRGECGPASAGHRQHQRFAGVLPANAADLWSRAAALPATRGRGAVELARSLVGYRIARVA